MQCRPECGSELRQTDRSHFGKRFRGCFTSLGRTATVSENPLKRSDPSRRDLPAASGRAHSGNGSADPIACGVATHTWTAMKGIFCQMSTKCIGSIPNSSDGTGTSMAKRLEELNREQLAGNVRRAHTQRSLVQSRGARERSARPGVRRGFLCAGAHKSGVHGASLSRGCPRTIEETLRY